jgi:hypothetical protein
MGRSGTPGGHPDRDNCGGLMPGKIGIPNGDDEYRGTRGPADENENDDERENHECSTPVDVLTLS